jgi:hypothetical protein
VFPKVFLGVFSFAGAALRHFLSVQRFTHDAPVGSNLAGYLSVAEARAGAV